MKHLRFFLMLCVVALFSASECAQKLTFPMLNNAEGVSKIYISKAMLSMAGKSANLGNVPANVTKNLDSMEIYTTETSTGTELLSTVFGEYVKSASNLEVLMQVRDGGDDVSIYGVRIPDSENMSSIIIYVKEDIWESTLIVMNGNIDPSQISGMVN